MPTPPYIKAPLEDATRYQTVFSRVEGSAAAPTAGLHFTEELLDAIRARGVEVTCITLHVGLDTFRPVRVDDPAQHRIHREWYQLEEGTAAAVRRTRSRGARVIAVGTTSAPAARERGRRRPRPAVHGMDRSADPPRLSVPGG